MKLPFWENSIEQQLKEFDVWITPSIQEIQDTKKFEQELEKVDSLIRSIGLATQNFLSKDYCTPESISRTCIDLIEEKISFSESVEEQLELTKGVLEALIALLFMVTGKTDNNLKCQFPVHLGQNDGRYYFPQKKLRKGIIEFENRPLGRTIKLENLSQVIANAIVYGSVDDGLSHLVEKAKWLLDQYLSILLKDDQSIKQFWALGNSYYNLLEVNPGSEKSLLAPIVIFKIRGSVSASGGHIPENMLRSMMEQWGLERGIDFNADDVTLPPSSGDSISAKTRAYDFILPYATKDWTPHIFIQCQFYAGDSGSVSHKVVDQTDASRTSTLKSFPNAMFIEYLDGAGYFASLNTDLRHMIEMESTFDFIQIRSAHIKLRRALQSIGFLTLVDIEHAVLRSDRGLLSSVRSILIDEKYALEEINRSISSYVERRLLNKEGDILSISVERLNFSRCLMIMDLVAITGHEIEKAEDLSGNILIPGYGSLYGNKINEISTEIDSYALNLDYSRTDFANDITWLAENKFVIIR